MSQSADAARRASQRVETFTIAFDVARMQPACILLQKAFGATIPAHYFYSCFDAEDWIVDRLEGIKLYATNPNEIVILAKKVRQSRGKISK